MTALEERIAKTRKEIAPDGYEMSIGEIVNLYRDGELFINPEFQRLFRWEPEQKTRFIESLLLGIPIPPIFVYMDQKGKWELIDGLQRLSTIFQFLGILKASPGEENRGPLVLAGTNFLPELEDKRWERSSDLVEDGIGTTAQLLLKRARMRVEILKSESDVTTKYELFQRLNTGGTRLSEQEVRNCTALMINPEFFYWLRSRSEFDAFKKTTVLTDTALKAQVGKELALRFVSFRLVPYTLGLDVHEYLDKALITLAQKTDFPAETEKDVFERTFTLLHDVLGANAFKRWDGERFGGGFLMSLFEVIAIGVSGNLREIEQRADRVDFLHDRVKTLWENETFKQNSGAGVRGTTRLARLLPLATTYFISQ